MSDFKKKLDRLRKERESRKKVRDLINNEKGTLTAEPEDPAPRDVLRNIERITKKKPLSSEDLAREDWGEEVIDVTEESAPDRRSLSETVERSWEKIGEKKELTTKEKLEQLISLTRQREGAEKKPRLRVKPELLEPLQFTENSYALDIRYGRVTLADGLEISSGLLSCLSNDPTFEEEDIDLSSALIIDLETTGLTGGSGVIPFNIGMGYYRDDRFIVSQFFLGDPAEEGRMIKELVELIQDSGFRSVVTYNGKAFDLPLLETRFILHRTPFPLADLPHLDFLFPARNLWKHKYESCRLFHLAHELVGTDRAEDIPSAEIPARYFQYIHTGNFELIEPILYHNQEDILSLLAVVILGAKVFSEDREGCSADAMDFFGAAKILEKQGNVAGSVSFFQRALNGRLTDEVSMAAKRKLSTHYKKNQAWDQAVALWREMADIEHVSRDLLFSLRELAIYFEHKSGDYEDAKGVTEEGLVLSMGFSSYYEKDFRYRLDRLNRKIRNRKEQNKKGR